MRILSLLRMLRVLFELFVFKIFGRLNSLSFPLIIHSGKSIQFVFDKKSNVSIGKSVGLRNNVFLSVRKNGYLHIGNGVFINNGCNIVCHKGISIGNRTKLGPNVLMFDHDYDYKRLDGLVSKIYLESEITIGEDCWIGAGCIILRNTRLGNNCIVGAGSILKGEYPDNSVIIQKRQTKIV